MPPQETKKTRGVKRPRIANDSVASTASSSATSSSATSSLAVPDDRTVQANVSHAVMDLDVACTEGYLVDLHSHLMGMGDATFWTNLMCDFIPHEVECPPTLCEDKRLPKVKEALKKSLVQIKFDKELRDAVNGGDWRERVIVELDMMKDNADNTAPTYKILKSASASNKDEAFKIRFPQDEKERLGNWQKYFTDDVIYSLDALDTAFDFRAKCGESSTEKERRVIDALRHAVPLHYEGDTPFPLNTSWLVFNARKRQFEFVKGIPNTIFAFALFKSREAILGMQGLRGTQLQASSPGFLETQKAAFCRALLNDAFEFSGRNGDKSSPIDLISTRGSFTPQFYPRRFKLKDCMYESKLCVLTQLMNHVVGHYTRSGVYYAEISLGPNDTMNPDVWFHIIQCFSTTGLKSVRAKSDEAEAGQVQVEQSKNDQPETDQEETGQSDTQAAPGYTTPSRYLGSPTRAPRNPPTFSPSKRAYTTGMLGKHPDGLFFVGFLAGLPRTSRYTFADLPSTTPLQFNIEKMEQEFPRYLGDEGLLPRMESCLQGTCSWDGKLKKHIAIPDRTSALRYYLENYLVGFDVMGDELYHPLTPLTHPRVKTIVDRMKILGQSGFGVRVHALENVSSDPEEREQHIRVLFHTMKWFVDNGIENLRIGHGSQLFSENNLDSTEGTRKLQEDFRLLLENNRIPVEVNITSNHLLLPNTAGANNNVFLMVRKMLDDGLRVIPGTDNDGIWPLSSCLEHKRHSSVSHELCTMLMHPLTAELLSSIGDNGKSRLMTMIEHARESTFWATSFEKDKRIKEIGSNKRWKDRCSKR